MSAAAQSGAYAQQDPYCTSDLRLDLTSNVYDYETQEPIVTSQRTSLSDEDVRYINFLNEVTHNSPSPDDIRDQSSAYPAAAAETPSATCGSADSAEVDADWEDEHPLGYPPELRFVSIFSPSQGTTENERSGQTSIDRGRRDDSGLGASIAPSMPLSVAGKELHAVAQASSRIDPRFAGVQGEEEVPHTTEMYPDEASPGFSGDLVPERDSHDLTEGMPAVADAVAAQVAPQQFPCGRLLKKDILCRTVCKTRGDLNHHLLSHDEEWKHRLPCEYCDKGFRYPKDVTHHVDTVHKKLKKACAFCGKEIADRKDNMRRHQRSSICRTAASSSSNAVSSQQSRRSAPANSGGSTQSRPRSKKGTKPTTRGVRVNPEASG